MRGSETAEWRREEWLGVRGVVRLGAREECLRMEVRRGRVSEEWLGGMVAGG